jgi:hypothetical protein
MIGLSETLALRHLGNTARQFCRHPERPRDFCRVLFRTTGVFVALAYTTRATSTLSALLALNSAEVNL